MADRMEALLNHFAVRARMFHSGALCGINELPGSGDVGQLHLVRSGPIVPPSSSTAAPGDPGSRAT